MKHQSDAPVPPRRLRPELPPEVEQIVLRALVKRPEGRQQSMEELAAQFSRHLAGDPEVLRTPVFGTAAAPMLTGRSTGRNPGSAPGSSPGRTTDPSAGRITDRTPDRIVPRSSSRGETLPLGDTLPLGALAPPAPEPMPSHPSTRIRRDTRSEVEVVSRRRSQVALAAVLGLLFLALLSGVIAALAVRPGDAAAPYVPPARHAEVVPRAEPPAVQVTAPVAVPAEPSGPGVVEASPAAHEPPPSVSAAAPPAPKPARPRPGRTPPGVGAGQRSRENAPSGNDLLDPYGPTAR